MTAILRLLLITMFALPLVGCAFGDDEGSRSQNARDQRERDELLQSFANVKGTYSGTLRDGLRDEPVEMILFVQDEATGQRDSQGRPVTRPSLFARIRTTEIVRYDARLTTRFYEETGELVMFSQGGAPSASPVAAMTTAAQSIALAAVSSIQGRLDTRSGVFSGEVTGPSGRIGSLEVRLVSREARLPGASDDIETNERLRRQYERVKGTWEGTLNDGQRVEPVRLVLFIQEERAATGDLTRPVLYGRFRTLDTVRFDEVFSTRYRPEIDELVLLGVGGEIQSISAKFDSPEEMTGSVGTTRGTLGTLRLQRTSTETPAPGSEEVERNERLRRQLETIKGTWEGTLSDGQRSDAVRLVLFIQEENAGTNPRGEIITRPVLYARFRTLDIIRHDYTFSTRYRPEQSELLLLNANAEIQNILGRFTAPEEFVGTASTSRGTLGTVTLRRTSLDTPAPGQGEENERNERIRRQLEPLVGKYRGTMKTLSSTTRPEGRGFTVELFLTTQTSPNGGVVPVLIGSYSLVDSAVADLTFSVIYKPELSPPQIVMSSQGVVTRPGNYFVTLDGELQADGKITGRHSTQMGVTGLFELTRIR